MERELTDELLVNLTKDIFNNDRNRFLPFGCPVLKRCDILNRDRGNAKVIDKIKYKFNSNHGKYYPKNFTTRSFIKKFKILEAK